MITLQSSTKKNVFQFNLYFSLRAGETQGKLFDVAREVITIKSLVLSSRLKIEDIAIAGSLSLMSRL